MTPHLFVYGTLLPDAGGFLGANERNRLRAAGDFLGNAFTTGVLLNLGDYPGLIVGMGRVSGGAYTLHDPAATLGWLDAYEGLTGSQNDEYARREIETTLAGGRVLTAWTYVFIGNSQGLCKIETGRWRPQQG